jgi:excisionase family DNA binding protein
MPRAIHAQEIIAADNPERSRFGQVARLLERAEDDGEVLVVHGDTRIALPRPAAVALQAIAERLARGNALALVPLHRDLRTQEAADLLGVSRPYLVGLLEQGAIPFSWTGRQRRVRLEDLLAYRDRRDRERRQHLDEVLRLSEDLGLYDD